MLFMRSLVQAPWLPTVARALISGIFVISGFEKLQNFSATVQTISSLTSPSIGMLMTVIVIVFELGGGLMVLANWNLDLGLDMLLIFLIVSTILVHANFGDPAKLQGNIIQIEKNIAILGGLLFIGRYFLRDAQQEV